MHVKLTKIAVPLVALAIGLFPCFATQAHEHIMDHSMHEHMQPGFTISTATYTAPDLKLMDSNGTEVALHELLNGKTPVILNFIYTSCTTICPVMSSTFQQIQLKLGKRKVRMLSVSIDPENDTPAKLKEYAHKYKAGVQWKLLTGTLENSIAVQRAFGVLAGDKMDHKPVTLLKAPGTGDTWVRIEGLADAGVVMHELDKFKAK